MKHSPLVIAAAAAAVGVAVSTPLDDYVSAPDPNYAWFDTGAVVE